MKNDLNHCGLIAIVGRPNVGKSTLLNALLGQKVSITSRKPQTTRHRILGILTEENHQAILVDTPGLHSDEKRAINRLMNRAASSSIAEVEMVVFLVEGTHWTQDDELVLSKVKQSGAPCILVVNKIDNVQDKAIDINKRNIFDLKDRVHTLEDQLNTLINKINNSVLVI